MGNFEISIMETREYKIVIEDAKDGFDALEKAKNVYNNDDKNNKNRKFKPENSKISKVDYNIRKRNVYRHNKDIID